jgi:DNA-binding response OmpR family regulator
MDAMPKPKILVVDDDPNIVDIVRQYLQRDGYPVLSALDGQQALDMVRQRHPDLIILDLMLPKVDGFDVCRIVRGEGHKMPIIIVTGRSAEEDTLLGLDLGADDYVTKPFSPRQLVARVRAVLRRTNDAWREDQSMVQVGGLVIDPLRFEVRARGEQVPITPREFKLLQALARQPGRVFTRGDLLNEVFGYDYEGLERTIDAHIMNLRRKIEPDPVHPTYIETVRGMGYRFVEQPRAA